MSEELAGQAEGEPVFRAEVSRHVWQPKYRYQNGPDGGDRTIQDSWRRMARALSAVGSRDQDHWEQRFVGILKGFEFLSGGRIQAGAGARRNVTLFNCFVMGTIEDSMEGTHSI